MTERDRETNNGAGGESAPPGIQDFRQLRDALSCFTTGVTIITAAGSNGVRVGLTANSFSSVSLNPPLVSWSLSLHSPSLAVFQDASHFAVHVLARNQQALSERFARPAQNKFDGIDYAEGLGGAPLIPDAIATFQCGNAYRYYGGDHVLFLGSVEAFESRPGDPLIFFRGNFCDLESNSKFT